MNETGTTQCPNCGAVIEMPGGVRIEVTGQSADDVGQVAGRLADDAARRRAADELRGPWATGSFYLVSLATLIVLLLIVAGSLSLALVPVVIVGAVLAVAVVGALQLRHDDRLSEEGFGRLMRLALEQLPRQARPGGDRFD